MTQNTEKWSWWVGIDDERYTTECDTREEAVLIAREEYEGAWIVEARKPDNIPLSRYFDAGRFIEDAEDNAYDDHADEDSGNLLFEMSPYRIKDLKDAVRAAIDQWQASNGLVFQGFKFSASRNQEWIEGPEGEKS